MQTTGADKRFIRRKGQQQRALTKREKGQKQSKKNVEKKVEGYSTYTDKSNKCCKENKLKARRQRRESTSPRARVNPQASGTGVRQEGSSCKDLTASSIESSP